MSWRNRFDTLAVRLLVLMWATLVLSHAAAYFLAIPLSESLFGPHAAPGAAPGFAPGPPPGPAPGPPPGSDRLAGMPTMPSLPPNLPSHVLWLDYGIRLIVIALGAALGSRWLAAPMKRLAQAAGTLGQGLADGRAPPQLDERHGAAEVRETARVFNHMATRLAEQFDARGLHMAAVSHDLRTPLTRLRMRLEALSAADTSAAAVADVHEMDELIDSSLAVLREQRDGAASSVVDLVALAQALLDDLAAQGHDVALGGMPQARVRAHPAALKRIVGNLVGNALRYGGRARVAIVPQAHGVELNVDDDGPGIALAEIEQAFQPWVRLQPGDAPSARGGQGLGLAIARDLAERDGGHLALANRAEGGLRATLVLPSA